MKPHEIENAIGEELADDAADYWNGCSRELRDEYVVLAQRDGFWNAVCDIRKDAMHNPTVD